MHSVVPLGSLAILRSRVCTTFGTVRLTRPCSPPIVPILCVRGAICAVRRPYDEPVADVHRGSRPNASLVAWSACLPAALSGRAQVSSTRSRTCTRYLGSLSYRPCGRPHVSTALSAHLWFLSGARCCPGCRG